LSPSSWSCTATQLHTRQKKATAATIAFFVELRCNATPHQEEEEGDNNVDAVTFFRSVALQHNKTSATVQRYLL
jgi:hypothetical protein